MDKSANTQPAVHELIRKRWSPRAFDNREVEPEKLERLFEAARWSASCFNEQPWRFIVGVRGRDETYSKIFGTLAEGNKIWCRHAPVLVLLAGKKLFSRNGKPNDWYLYDLGQAAAYISVQATAEGLYVHQMAGFDARKAQTLFRVPDDYRVFTAMAIGYLGNPEILPEDLKKSESAPRERIELKNLVFAEKWGENFNWK
ncbi:MAG: nitroreductase family protein [Calditrichaeota bacterium]|nr:nitroreductase family protein [Calditrichota bacterium]